MIQTNNGKNTMKLTQKTALITIITAVLVCAAALIVVSTNKNKSAQTATTQYITQSVFAGTMSRTISASGTLNPVNQVTVGSQTSGTIQTIAVDFNSPVKAGQLLAQIDTSTLDADLAQATAMLRSAQTTLSLANNRLARNQDLFNKGFIAKAEVDEASSAVASAQATIDQQTASVNRASITKRNANIVSPVTGIVVSREVSVGQTVAASLSTPVLFKIAQDLKEMQIEANVAEADVGLIALGQSVSFTVDAFSGRTFTGLVHQIRNNYTVQQNVVTYGVIIRARNEDLILRPGMTAYVKVLVAQRDQVLRIPNAALRFKPKFDNASESSQTQQTNTKTQDSTGKGEATKTVWRLGEDRKPQMLELVLGVSDGKFTEMVSGDVKTGDLLIVGQPEAGAAFGPKIF